jgi:hypothetical protein
VVRIDFAGVRAGLSTVSAFLKKQFPSQLLTSEESAVQNAAADSPLAQGDWYRMEVKETGIYRIDQDFLSKAGISLSAIGNINSIRVLGNGGGELPAKRVG